MILHIGYVIQTTNAAFDPNALYPWQVWERYAKGRVLVGVDEADTTFSAAGKTAGAKTHTLTVDQMPSHAHGMGYATCWDGVKSSGWIVGANSGSRVDRTSYAGGGKAHNNMQPSIAVYMWRRIE